MKHTHTGENRELWMMGHLNECLNVRGLDMSLKGSAIHTEHQLVPHAMVQAKPSQLERRLMMTNAFEKFGIKHLSASSLNLYTAQPSLWVGKYLLKWKDEVGAGAWRGSAVEAGINLALYDFEATLEQCHSKALELFEKDAMGDCDEKVDKERASILPMLEQAIPVYREAGKPVRTQKKILTWIDGVDVPLIGFVDYEYTTSLNDLKTTHRIPSKPSPAHCAQVAIYEKATGKKPSLTYVSTKKTATYEVEDIEEHWQQVVRSAKAIQTLLTRSETGREALEIFSPDFSSFYWSEQTKQNATEALIYV
ncbi:hypothetical protein [Sneathiella glossodoripedis]|uniref:hypothetical protein n=1 Tax=Sneathiella glossodoripedis TaxID=418853 RepID=UPI00046ED16E|nr:hypothetical protein [Sneathiella glossodoripedis]